ncbi:hypothetical protein Esti_000409 [Eimeria stiedai]
MNSNASLYWRPGRGFTLPLPLKRIGVRLRGEGDVLAVLSPRSSSAASEKETMTLDIDLVEAAATTAGLLVEERFPFLWLILMEDGVFESSSLALKHEPGGCSLQKQKDRGCTQQIHVEGQPHASSVLLPLHYEEAESRWAAANPERSKEAQEVAKASPVWSAQHTTGGYANTCEGRVDFCGSRLRSASRHRRGTTCEVTGNASGCVGGSGACSSARSQNSFFNSESCSAIQAAKEAVSHTPTDAEKPYVNPCPQVRHPELTCTLQTTSPAFVSLLAVKPVQNQLHSSRRACLECSNTGGDVQDHVIIGSSSIRIEDMHEPSEEAARSSTEGISGFHELHQHGAQKRNSGSAWTRLVRVGSKLLGVRKSGHGSATETTKSVAGGDATRDNGLRATESSFLPNALPIHLTSPRRGFSAPAVGITWHKLEPAAGLDRLRESPRDIQALDLDACEALQSCPAEMNSDTAGERRASGVSQEGTLVQAEAGDDQKATAKSAAITVAVETETEQKDCLRLVTIACSEGGAEAAHHRRFQQECCERAVVSTTRLEQLRSTSACLESVHSPVSAASSVSFIVVSRASGGSSPVSPASAATNNSDTPKSKFELHRLKEGKPHQAANLSCESAGHVEASSFRGVAVSPHALSRQRMLQVPQSTASYSRDRDSAGMGSPAHRQDRSSLIKGNVQESHIKLVGGAATRHARLIGTNECKSVTAARKPCKPLTKQLCCEPALVSEDANSDCEFFSSQLPSVSADALEHALHDVGDNEATATGAPIESALSTDRNRSACDTMQFCSLPDPHPADIRDPLVAESASLEAPRSGLEERDSTAPLDEARTAGMEGADELRIEGSAAPLACAPVSLQEAFGETGGRVAIETDDEDFSPPAGLSIDRPDSPCSPPLGLSVSGPAIKLKKESGSLQQTLSSLWNELEVAHRGVVEPAGSSREASSSCAPELATWEFSLPPADTVGVVMAECSLNFLKSAAHASAAATVEKADEHWKSKAPATVENADEHRKSKAPFIEKMENSVSKSPRHHAGGPNTSQRKNTWNFNSAGGEGAPEEQAKKGRKALHSTHSKEFRRPDYQLQTDVPQGPADSASVVSEMISRLKENMSEQAEGWWRMSMTRFANMPLLASYETCAKDVVSRTSEIQNELAPGPNENSIFSSNWHDRLQWTFQQVLTLRESQESRLASQLRRMLFDRELALSHEIGSFAAAARAAAVVLIHSLAMEDGLSTSQSFKASAVERQMRKGPAQCFIRITPEDYPTVWSVYKPKFACDQLYVFDSLVFTVILGDPQANIHSYASKEVYQNDMKGRQAMADAIYASCLARKHQTDLSIRGNTRFEHDTRDDPGQQVDTVWNTHGQAKFERAKLGLPIACLVDYAGFAVLVEPLLPLNPAPVNVLEELAADIRGHLPGFASQCESIGNLLACFDALDKVDRATYNKFKNIAGFLNLADYPFPRGASDFELPLPPAALWRSQVDHFCIFRNLHEMLPPKCAGGREQRFRQTFVSQGSDVALPCTSREQHRAADSFSSKFASRKTTLRGSLEALEVAAHSMELAIKQDLVPVINGLQKNFLDSFDISHALHAHGINLRNVGELLNHGPASPFRDAIVREIVARSAKRLFRMQVAKLSRGKLEETTHMEEIQRLVVTLFNLVLSTHEESRMFWLHQIFPLALGRYKVDLTEITSPESVCTYSLFKAMEYNLGVQFDTRVAIRSANGSGEATLELRLPLTVADLSTFSSARESLLFPHVSHVRAALLGNDQAEVSARDAEAADAHVGRLRSTKWRMRHFFESDDADKAFQDRHKSTTADVAGELHTFAELREVRGFYPKVALVAPNTFALMQAAASSTVAGASSFSLDVLLENMKAGLVVTSSREEIWGSGNFAMHGVCGAMRSVLMGTGYPCHPYCLAVDKDLSLGSALLSGPDKRISQFPLRHCLRYRRKRLALTLALLLKAAVGIDILLLGKILQQTAYIMLQHNEVKAAASIADYIYSKIPDGLSLHSEAMLLDMQCTTKGTHPQDALMSYRSLKPMLIAMEGKMSLRLLLADLLLASFAFKNKSYNAAIQHAFRVHKISAVCFDTGGAHWAAIAALRLIARSMLEVQRCSEAIIILQHAVRAASTNPALPALVTHMTRFWLVAAFARMGRLENASVEAQSMLAGLESQLGANHEGTMSALYLAAEVKMRIGCLALQHPPLKIEGQVDGNDGERTVCGAPGQLQEPLLWKPLEAEDLEVYENIFRDRAMIQARADAEQLFLALFRRLLFREDNVLVEVYQPPGLERQQRQRQIFSTLKQLLKLKLCSIPIAVLRLLAHRIYITCVSQGCSTSLRLFGLMEQAQTTGEDACDQTDDDRDEDRKRLTSNTHIAADRTRVYFKRYPRLRVGCRPASTASKHRAAEVSECGCKGRSSVREGDPQEPRDDHTDYPFSFYSRQKVSGTEHRRAVGNDFLYACVDGSSGMRPTQEHDDVMLQLLLFCEGPPSLKGVLKSCYMSCMEDRESNPSTWMDGLISDVLSERGSLQHLRFLVCMLRQFFTLSQKSLFISLAPGDFNRKRHAQILIQTMRGQNVEEEDYFEYEIDSPRQFDLMVGMTQCEELLNATTWTEEDDLLEVSSTEADHPSRAANGGGSTPYHRSELAAVEENYLQVPAMGEGSISGKTAWKSMSTAARLSQLRFSSSSQFVANASPVAYGVMHDVFRPQDDSELEAFGCVECLQSPDKVPYLGG